MTASVIKESGEIDFNFALQYTDLMAQLIAQGTRSCLNKDVEMWLLCLKSLFIKGRIFEKKKEKIEEISKILGEIETKVNSKNNVGNNPQNLNKVYNEAFQKCFEAEEKILRMCDDNNLLIKKLRVRDYEALKKAILD